MKSCPMHLVQDMGIGVVIIELLGLSSLMGVQRMQKTAISLRNVCFQHKLPVDEVKSNFPIVHMYSLFWMLLIRQVSYG